MERKIEIFSDIKNICELEFFLNSLKNEANISRKNFCRMFLSVNEAVVNSLKHGNHFEFTKRVMIQFIEKDDCYHFIVEDEGNGFMFNEIKNPLDKENITKESGRGIFIMKQYTDKMYFEENGRVVNLLFYK